MELKVLNVKEKFSVSLARIEDAASGAKTGAWFGKSMEGGCNISSPPKSPFQTGDLEGMSMFHEYSCSMAFRRLKISSFTGVGI